MRVSQVVNAIFLRFSSRFCIKGHSFSMHEKFSEKLTFTTPDTRVYVCVSESKKC